MTVDNLTYMLSKFLRSLATMYLISNNHFNATHQFASSWWQKITFSRTAFETPKSETICEHSNVMYHKAVQHVAKAKRLRTHNHQLKCALQQKSMFETWLIWLKSKKSTYCWADNSQRLETAE